MALDDLVRTPTPYRRHIDREHHGCDDVKFS